MKQILTLAVFLLLMIKATAQTDGISYQAVIIGPDILELPGVNAEGNYLPLATVAIKFTIFDSGNEVEFQEVQITETDEFGRVNLIIGDVEHDYFEKINWDGTAKDLKVEIDFDGGSNFVDMNREKLTFVPYAYHRNITATGTLTVDDDTFLNRELNVDGQTNLNGTLFVTGKNATNLSGDLTVDGVTNLNGTLDVNNQSTTNLSGALNVGASGGIDDVASTILNGSLKVIGDTEVNNFQANGLAKFKTLEAESLKVSFSTNLFGSVILNDQITMNSPYPIKINSTVSGPDDNINNYPLVIEGGQHGIAIRVNQSRSNATNYITFFDNQVLKSWGRIEGETPDEFKFNDDYLFDQSSLEYDIFDANLDLAWASIDIVIEGFDLAAAYTDFRPCLGFGACTTSPGFADIAASVASVALVITKEVFAIKGKVRADENKETYDKNKLKNKGVTYASGAGDYAEFLLRENVNEKITFGDIVGVKGGKVSKNSKDAERMMVVSLKPIVLGNMPQPNRENEYEKVAFMGQVPVKVFGKVNIGDYILPSGKNDGIGIAINPSKISTDNIKKVVGIAWEESNNIGSFNMINVAVGLNANYNNPIIKKLEDNVSKQAQEIAVLKNQLTGILEKLSKIEQGDLDHSQDQITDNHTGNRKGHNGERDYEVLDTPDGEIIYFEMTDEDFEKGLEMAKNQLNEQGIDFSENDFWKRVKDDAAFKTKLKNKLKNKFHKQIHYHKEVNKRSGR